MKFFRIKYGSDDDRQIAGQDQKNRIRIDNHSYEKNDKKTVRIRNASQKEEGFVKIQSLLHQLTVCLCSIVGILR